MKNADGSMRRVAVIAVHGVADQQPFETARIAADLLTRAAAAQEQLRTQERTIVFTGRETPEDASGPAIADIWGDRRAEDQDVPTGRYQAFQESKIRIPVSPVLTAKDEQSFATAASEQPQSRTLRQKFGGLQTSRTAAAMIAGVAADPGEGDVGLRYMREQLSGHELDEEDAVYETIKLESLREGSLARVDVFELYWADLSRFVGNWLRWIIEFYQLLFFLCSLGRKSLEFARASCEPGAKKSTQFWRVWPFFAACQHVAEQILVLWVPVFNIYLLGIASCILPLLIPAEWAHVAGSVFLIILLTLGMAAGVYWKRYVFAPGGRSWPWLMVLPALALGGALGFQFVSRGSGHFDYRALLIEWWLIVVVGITWLMLAFQKTRPGAKVAGVIAAGLASICFVGEMLYSNPGLTASDPKTLMHVVVRAAQWVLGLLGSGWLLIVLAAIGATAAGFLVPRAVLFPDPVEQVKELDKARRAAWTANLTLVLPALVIVILNLTLWQAFLTLTVPTEAVPKVIPHEEKSSSPLAFVKESQLWNERIPPLPRLAVRSATDLKNLQAWDIAGHLMKGSYSPFFWLVAGFFSAATFLLAWSILPSVIAELRLGEQKNQTEQQRHADSRWLGESLLAGFRAMRVSGETVRWIFLALLPLGILAAIGRKYFDWGDYFKWADQANHYVLLVGAWLLLAIIVGQGPFKVIALGLRTVLDVALDVINWLRLHPIESTPRARICARLLSLIRHIEDPRHASEKGDYSAIVILAHSQGTIIVADLLRFLNHPSNAHLKTRLPIYLFTMGNPLRQLYSLRFPHLYAWGRHSADAWAGDAPDPAELGLERWVNAYRSGDYVGRYLWHPDGCALSAEIWSVEHDFRDSLGRKREFCLGAGAHTHYWDETAPEVAFELDQLVGRAALGIL